MTHTHKYSGIKVESHTKKRYSGSRVVKVEYRNFKERVGEGLTQGCSPMEEDRLCSENCSVLKPGGKGRFQRGITSLHGWDSSMYWTHCLSLDAWHFPCAELNSCKWKSLSRMWITWDSPYFWAIGRKNSRSVWHLKILTLGPSFLPNRKTLLGCQFKGSQHARNFWGLAVLLSLTSNLQIPAVP